MQWSSSGPQAPHALTVSSVVGFVRELLENNDTLTDLWVQGEISTYSRSGLGHRYFSLKDERSVLRSVLFRDDMPGVELQAGDRVLVHGRVSIYFPRGELQFVADFVSPEGLGILAAKFEQLKQKLDAEGLFDVARKRPLPRFPLRIGLVTSPHAAAFQDIKNVLSRRWPLATLVLAPSLVQGDKAPGQIVAALRRLAKEPGLDVAIVARGGGSIEDLWAFNDERVARAIFGFPVPVVTGVGHEPDETIADLVADLRAPTPSAAAERSSPDIHQMERAISILLRTMGSAARRGLATSAGDVGRLAAQLQRGAPDIRLQRRDVAAVALAIQANVDRQAAADRARVEQSAARLTTLDPMATLARGFAIVQEAGGRRRVINSSRKVKSGHRLSVSVADGAFWAEVS